MTADLPPGVVACIRAALTVDETQIDLTGLFDVVSALLHDAPEHIWAPVKQALDDTATGLRMSSATRAALEALVGPVAPMSEKLGRFGHHPLHADDFCVEVEALLGMEADVRAGLAEMTDLRSRVEKALSFRVGGDEFAVAAMASLRDLADRIVGPDPRDAEIARLTAERDAARAKLQAAYDTLVEINPSNYVHEDVCRQNDAAVEVILSIQAFFAALQPGKEARDG